MSTPAPGSAALLARQIVSLEPILRTDELQLRRARRPDYKAESRALGILSRTLAGTPTTLLQTLAETILETLRVGSAGVSLLTPGGKRFYWPAIAGAWKPYVGGGTPRDFGPCGDALDHNSPLLFTRFERRYAYLLDVTPAAEEALFIPVSVEGKAVGAIWAMIHDRRRRFDAEDLRLLESLGHMASAVFQKVQLEKAESSRRAALNLMEDALQARQALEQLNLKLGESERRFREMIDALPAAVYTTDAEGRLTHFNPAAVQFSGRTPQVGSDRWCVSWKLFRPDGTPLPHDAFPMAIALAEGRPIRGEQIIAERPDGTRRWLEPFPTPLLDTEGRVVGGINMLVDITERKAAEEALRATTAEQAADLADLQELQKTSAQLVQGGDVARLYAAILQAAAALLRSDFASLQLLRPHAGSGGELQLLAYRGFSGEAARFWQRVRFESASTCGEALRTGRRIIASDVEACDFMAGTEDLAMYRQSGIRAVQTTPLRSRSGQVLGMMSTHWRGPHEPSERELRRFDVLARQAADLLERSQSQGLLSGQSQVLEALAAGAPLGEVLAALIVLVEEHSDGFRGSILVNHPDGTRFALGVAPSLPDAWVEALRQTPISPSHTPCGRAAQRGEAVSVPDIAADREWSQEWRALTVGHGLRTCYAAPIRGVSGVLLGSFGIYYPALRDPRPTNEALVEIATHLAGIAIERKLAEDELSASEARYREVLVNMGEGLYSVDAEGVVTSLNPATERILGWSRDELLGRKMHDLTHFKHRDGSPFPAEECAGLQVLREGKVLSDYEDVFIRKDGTFVDVVYSASPLYADGSDEIVGLVVVFRDISQRVAMERELKRQADQLLDESRRKNEFLAMLAHELRNPLAPIRNGLQVLRDSTCQMRGSPEDEVVESASLMMERQLGHLVRLVDDLLDVSRISRGKIELRREQVELSSVVKDAVESTGPLCERMGHRLTVTLPPEPVYLHGDSTRLIQVIGNLLSNACKFTNKGGHVELTLEVEGGWAVIRVSDTGIGIAADQLPRIFEMFTQVDGSLERAESGLGIGLTLVRNLVEMQGGTVEGQSAGLGQGSEFVVRLPILTEPAEAPATEPTVRERTVTTPLRVLVVDDNRDSATSLAMLLSMAGHDTRSVYDGLDALEAVAAWGPDVVLLDIGLPQLNGYEVARRVREQPWGKQVMLVALTGWGQEEDRRTSREAGFDDHVVKPVDPASILRLLASCGKENPRGEH